MSGRGQGSYRRGKGSGQSSHQSYATAAKGTNDNESDRGNKHGVFVLSGRQPGSNVVVRWLKAMHSWTGQELSRHGLHWLVHPTLAREVPPPAAPVRPDPEDYDDDDEEKLNEADYKTDSAIYMDDLKEHKKKMKELKEDKTKMFNFLVSNIDPETQSTISNRKDVEIWTRENPSELIKAIKTLFMGHVDGTMGNAFDVDKAETKFANVKQRVDQTAAEFKLQYDQEFEAMIQAQVNGGAKEAEARAVWTEEKKVKHYTARMNMARMPPGNFCELHKFGSPPKPLPATISDAYNQQCTAENQMIGTAQTTTTRANVFAMGGVKQAGGKGQNQRETAGGTKSGKQEKVPIPDAERPKDSEGKWVCWNYIIGNCNKTAEACSFSHKRVVNGKAPPSDWLEKVSAKARRRGDVDGDIVTAMQETRAAIANSLLAPKTKASDKID